MRRRRTNNLDDAFNEAYHQLSSLPPSVVNVNMRDCRGRTLVHKAVEEGSTDRLADCLSAGCDVNAVDQRGQVPLLIALKQADVAIVSTLITGGASVNAMHCDYDMLTWAVNLYMADIPESSFVDTCAVEKCMDLCTIIKMLLRAGADPDTRQGRMWTPLQYVLKQTRTSRIFPEKMCRMLLEHGADPDSQLSENTFTTVTPICIAVDFVNFPAVRLLLQHNCSLNWYDLETGNKCSPVPKKPSVLQKHSSVFLKILHILCDFGCDLKPALPQLKALVESWDLNPEQNYVWCELEDRVRHPASLLSLCVKAVRAHLGHNLSKEVPLLNLPISLQNYVSAQNLS